MADSKVTDLTSVGTIDGTEVLYVAKGGADYKTTVQDVINAVPSASVAWGGVTGTLSSQTDLQTALDGKASLTGATFSGNVLGTNFRASSSAGLVLQTNGGSDCLHIGNGGGVNATAYGGWNFDGATTNTIAYFNGSKTLTAASTATYPNLTELSYVKGVTSAIQTQLDGKANSSHTHSLSDLTQSGATNGQVPTWNGSAWAAATPSGGGGLSSFDGGGYRSTYKYLGGIGSYLANVGALVANTAYFQPFAVKATQTFTAIGTEVTTASGAGTLIRLGIYNVANGVPTSLVLDAGTVAASSTGIKEITISQSLSQGLYALVAVSDSTPTVRHLGGATNQSSWAHFTGTSALDGSTWTGQTASFTFGALPAIWSATVSSSTAGRMCVWLGA